MKELKFKYYALTYLNIWLESDKSYYEGIRNGNESQKIEAIKGLVSLYRVARNLPTRYDEGQNIVRFRPVLDLIEEHNIDVINSCYIGKVVEEFNNKLCNIYNDGKNKLSFTTKLLWFKYRHPIVIYDRNAGKALQLVVKNADDYGRYCEKWRKEYAEHEKAIEMACKSLQAVTEYSVRPDVATEEYVKTITAEQWFKDRVFDMYLWKK